MELFVRKSLKDQNGYYEKIIKDVEVITFSFADLTGTKHIEEDTFKIKDSFVSKGEILIPKSSLNTMIFNLDSSKDFYYSQSKNLSMFNDINIPNSIHMISLNEVELADNWKIYYDNIIERAYYYAKLCKDKRDNKILYKEE